MAVIEPLSSSRSLANLMFSVSMHWCRIREGRQAGHWMRFSLHDEGARGRGYIGTYVRFRGGGHDCGGGALRRRGDARGRGDGDLDPRLLPIEGHRWREA